VNPYLVNDDNLDFTHRVNYTVLFGDSLTTIARKAMNRTIIQDIFGYINLQEFDEDLNEIDEIQVPYIVRNQSRLQKKSYKVQENDTLRGLIDYFIHDSLNESVMMITNINNISDPNVIRVQQVISVPENLNRSFVNDPKPSLRTVS